MDKIDKIDNVEFYKDIYLFEIARKENLNSKISTYIGLLTVIGGIVVFELENLYQNLNVNPIIQFELIVMIMIILGINIYNLYKANHGKEYKYLDNSIEVRKAFVELERYYQQYYEYFKNEEETRRFIDNAFRDGQVKTNGTDIEKILPPMSRFGGRNRAEKKENIIVKVKKFFEKYFGLGTADRNDDGFEYKVTDEEEGYNLSRVAEDGEKYRLNG